MALSVEIKIGKRRVQLVFAQSPTTAHIRNDAGALVMRPTKTRQKTPKVRKGHALAFLIILVGCTRHEPVDPPDVKANSNPTERYEILITFKDAPTTLRAFKGKVQYNIANASDCVPLDYTMGLGGITPTFKKELDIEFERLSDDKFSSSFFNDSFLDENYYGLAVCDWKASIISARLDMPDSKFTRLAVNTSSLLKGNTIKRFCLQQNYVAMDVEAICRGLQGVQKDTEPRSWYFEVSVNARRG